MTGTMNLRSSVEGLGLGNTSKRDKYKENKYVKNHWNRLRNY